ncbi:STAS domain-containing protein [Allokutzneria albata]|uniref:Anti-sigma factor antagonist n=1 Tax=Allokutzneria albata TaxID=211114 RepID=A0A1H0DAH5_ALLAB|nr:STAS domain-containing protein [Allokutzneria albata]SDN67125.1 anti-anti-sigma factor [Allokutzneria albata]
MTWHADRHARGEGGDGPDAGELIQLSVRPLPGGAVVHVRGEIDMLSAAPLRQECAGRLDGAEALLVLDLSEVTFLGSSGLSVLAETAELAKARNKRLRLVYQGPVVGNPLSVTGMDTEFDSYETLDRALADQS